MDTNFEAFQPKIFQLVSKACKKKKRPRNWLLRLKVDEFIKALVI